jgi:outer membrane protein assembly factor BamD
MSRRMLSIAVLGVLLALTAACTNKKSVNPLATVGSKQPDKILFDKAMDAMRHNRFDVARLTLQTLINTYPDSEFIARAKLAVGDSWYAEGGTASLAQAEQEYSDFQIFFPNMPEAAEAQMKIAQIHYDQMEKPDRDYTHAKRAEDEYRKMILQYPDSKLVPEAKRRLLEVQEVLAEREFEIGRFYYLRQSYPASMARLESVVDEYPLYSKADQALYLLGQNYEGQIARLHAIPACDAHGQPRGCVLEAAKAKYIEEFTKKAADAYDKILTRYPIMDSADDAKRRLIALHQPVPRPTKAEVARNKAEDDSRHDATMAERLMGVMKKGPDTSQASTIGEPTLQGQEPVAATTVVQRDTMAAMGVEKGTATIEVVKPGEEAAKTGEGTTSDNAASNTNPFARPTGTTATAQDPNELKPDSNELTPTNTASVDDNTLPPPPPQVNELADGQSAASSTTTIASAKDGSQLASDKDISSSKKKKKKGLRKLNPF